MKKNPHSIFFEAALLEAQKAALNNEVPIGAVIIRDGQIIARAFNETEKRNTFTAHAEILCIERACQKLKTKYLNDCELYITLEPCRMCLTAAKLSRIEAIHFILKSEKFGRTGKALKKTNCRATGKLHRDAASSMLQAFFKKKR